MAKVKKKEKTPVEPKPKKRVKRRATFAEIETAHKEAIRQSKSLTLFMLEG